ncbi:WD40 domain protein [Rhizoctonia solani 123E]|uniref:WD40 domain protein n=1 Tax=Rhizoctonia solani 123E TaxID=1423351 RepID=A0A074S4E1_9AGAM|nr:WD40 domain protein [Rhizoctonia solani 123E]
MPTGEYVNVTSFEAPASFTALTFTGAGILLAGGEDGTLRVYDLSPASQRALCKAIKGLPGEVSSICCQPSKLPPVALGKAWIASGKRVLLFDLDSDTLVIRSQEAQEVATLIEDDGDEDNVLNQIAVSKDMIAYSCDSGAVGVYDIQTKKRRVMKAMHSSICGTVGFAPTRPRESKFVSGGYDSQLLHFDASTGSVLSRLDISAPASTGDSPISLAPPFLYSVTIDSNGAMATGTADGRVIVGRGGERGQGDRPNRRKWNGLNIDMVSQYHIAEGPVIGVAWVGPSELLSVTLRGRIKHLRLPELQQKTGSTIGNMMIQTLWEAYTSKVNKVDCLATFTTSENVLHIAIGGRTSTGRGCVEVWKRECERKAQ